MAVCFGWKFFFLVSGIGTLNEIFISIVLMFRTTVVRDDVFSRFVDVNLWLRL